MLDTFRRFALGCASQPIECCLEAPSELAMSRSKLTHRQINLPNRDAVRYALRAALLAGALSVWLTASGSVEAAVVCGSAIRGATMDASPRRSQRPAAPRACHRRHESPLHGTTSHFGGSHFGGSHFGGNHSGGAGSQSPTDGPNAGPPAALDEKTREAGQDCVSRLACSQRTVLPPPLKDRFFRPPRRSVV